MNRIPLSSTSIASAGYDSNSHTLEVEFRSGGLYQYFDVPCTVYESFMSAESAGQFLNAHVRGAFRYAKL